MAGAAADATDEVRDAARALNDAFRDAERATAGFADGLARLGGARQADVTDVEARLSAAYDAIRAERFDAEARHLDGIVALNERAADDIEGAYRAGLGAVRRQFRALEFDARAILRAILGDLAGSLAEQGIGAIGAGVFGALGGLFQGAFADGGSVSAGRAALVGEQGPELFVPRAAGAIVPNGTLRGGPAVIVNQTVTIAAGVAPTVRAEMAALLPVFKRETIAAVIDAQQRSGGALF
jgi:hypothetical protein